MARSLADKLGLKPGDSLFTLNAPAGWLPDPPPGVTETTTSAAVGVLFARDLAALAAGLAPLQAAVRPGGRLWIAYPKKSGPLQSDLSRDEGFDLLTAQDWHPVAQVAVDPTWSALRFRPRSEIKVMTRKR